MSTAPINLRYGQKKEISATASSQRVQVSNAGEGSTQMRIHNRGTDIAAFSFGNSTVTASLTTDPTIPPGGVEVVTVTPNADGLWFAVIAGSSIGTVEVTPGAGV